MNCSCFTLIKRKRKHFFSSNDLTVLEYPQVEQLSHMLDSLLPPAESSNFLGPDVTEAIFLSSLTWSCGGGLLEGGRTVFDQLVKRLASLPQNPAAGSVVGPGTSCAVLRQWWQFN